MQKTLLHGLFPVVRAEVLRLLFTNPGQELYVRELARLSFLSLQDELAKLETADLNFKSQQRLSTFLPRQSETSTLYRVAEDGDQGRFATKACSPGEGE